MVPIRCSFSLTKPRCSSEELLDRLFKKGVVTEAEVISAFSLPEGVPRVRAHAPVPRHSLFRSESLVASKVPRYNQPLLPLLAIPAQLYE